MEASYLALPGLAPRMCAILAFTDVQLGFVSRSVQFGMAQRFRDMAKRSFTVLGVAVEFHTTESFVKSVLPPGFEPAEEATGLVRIGNMQSELCGDFSACTTIINATQAM